MLSFWFVIVCICLLLQVYLSKRKYGKYILIILSIILSTIITVICFKIDYRMMSVKGLFNYKALIRDTVRWFLFLNIPTLLFILINHNKNSKVCIKEDNKEFENEEETDQQV